jgi:hypothetical protein
MLVIGGYLLGIVIVFPIIAMVTYYFLKEDNHVHPSIHGIFKVMEAKNQDGLFVIAVIFYPLTLIVGAVVLLVAIIWLSTDKIFKSFSSSKVLDARIKLITVGSEIAYTGHTGKGSEILTVKVTEVNDSDIVISMENRIGTPQYRRITRDNITIYNDELLILG